MPNVIVEFEFNGMNFVEIINTDNLKKTNDFPTEARFAGHLDAAMESPKKGGDMALEVFASYHKGNFKHRVVMDLPCMVEDHIVIKVI